MAEEIGMPNQEPAPSEWHMDEFEHWWDTMTTCSGDPKAMARVGWIAAMRWRTVTNLTEQAGRAAKGESIATDRPVSSRPSLPDKDLL